MNWKQKVSLLPRKLGIVLLVVVSTAWLATLRIDDAFVVQVARQTAFDTLQRAAPRPYVESPVRIVDIDERSLAEFGQWPWPRDRLAELTDRLHAAGAAAVVYDFLFIERDRMASREPGGIDTDAVFADALRRGNVVLGFSASGQSAIVSQSKAGFALTGENPVAAVTRMRGGVAVLPELAEAAAGLGSVNLRADNSATAVRSVQLMWSDGKQLHPSLIAEGLRIAQGAQTYVVNSDPEIGGVQSIRIGAFDVPTGPAGEMIIHYTRPRADRYISASDIFDNQTLTSLVPRIGGHIVLVGTSAAGLFDLRRTSLGDVVPGVEMHAQAMEQILNGQYLVRKDWTRTAELLILVIGSLSVGLATIFGGARTALLLGAAFSSVIVFAAWYAFTRLGILVDFSFPLACGLAVWFMATAFRYAVIDNQRRGMRAAFSRYVHPSVLREIEENHANVELGGENCDLTVLFTDVRNFTPLSERLKPDELVAFLNHLLGRQADVITAKHGVIDKFIGDAVMAFWNAPLREPDHPRLACEAALELRSAIAEMNRENLFGLPEEISAKAQIAIGVGINTGLACVGNVGSEQRFNYSAIGDAVNIAARAESATKEVAYDLVVCRSTAAQVPDFAFLDAGGLALKGKEERVAIMVLVGDAETRASEDFQALEAAHADFAAAMRGDDRAAVAEALETCKSLAAAVDPGLAAFYERAVRRREDFGVVSKALAAPKVAALARLHGLGG